jgi:hypothetical protein
MSVDFPVKISQGEIFVGSAHGRIADTNFILYLTTREKHPSAEVICTGLFTHVRIFATPETIRPSSEDGRHAPILEEEPSTLVELPGGWEVGVTACSHTDCILGVKSPSLTESHRIHFTEVL